MKTVLLTLGLTLGLISCTNEAAESQERLNLKLEQDNRMMELNAKIREQDNSLIDAETNAKTRLLNKELELLKNK